MTARPEVEGRVAPDLDDVEWVEVGRLEPFEGNPRTISDAERGRLARSLRRFGFREPLVVRREDGLVVGGHQRLDVALELGYGEVPVAWVEGLSDEDAAALNVALNNPHAQGGWDEDRLAALVASLDEQGVDVSATGFPDDRVEELLELAAPTETEQDDHDPEPPEDPESCPGEVYELGDHRLMCGDATDPSDVDQLLDGADPQMVMTSPPYWVGKDYERQNSWSDVLDFISTCAEMMAGAVRAGGRIVVNTGTAQRGALFHDHVEMDLLLNRWQDALRPHGWHLRHARVWAKAGGIGGLVGPGSDVVDMHWEFIGTFYNPGHDFDGQRRAEKAWANQGVWDDVQGAATEAEHVASYPVEIPARNLRLYSDRGEPVLDPFAGAATTLVAAEQLGRRCLAMEIDPAYCDVARRRYADLVGDPSLAP